MEEDFFRNRIWRSEDVQCGIIEIPVWHCADNRMYQDLHINILCANKIYFEMLGPDVAASTILRFSFSMCIAFLKGVSYVEK